MSKTSKFLSTSTTVNDLFLLENLIIIKFLSFYDIKGMFVFAWFKLETQK